MDEEPLYRQIAEAIRQEILRGEVGSGERLPSIRETAERWACTPGTAQRAYAELAEQGLVEGRPGRGTLVIAPPPEDGAVDLRRASLLHRVEGFLLETMSTGYRVDEVEEALRLALDRWRALAAPRSSPPDDALRFAGGHDPALSLLAERFPGLTEGLSLHVQFAGSLGGLMKLAQGEVEVAGCHLWDTESGEYNVPFVRRLLHGRRVALLTLAHRTFGLMVPRGNPRGLARVADLATGELRFVNRQPGSGTRVWLEAQLQRQGLHLKQLPRLPREALTHLEAARRVAEGQGDVAVGVEAAARVAGLDFVPLARERYDLVIPYFVWQRFALERVQVWLGEEEARSAIEALEGYETAGSGRVRWVGELPHKMKTRFEGEGTDADTPRAARRRDPSTD